MILLHKCLIVHLNFFYYIFGQFFFTQKLLHQRQISLFCFTAKTSPISFLIREAGVFECPMFSFQSMFFRQK
ncbi:hypothetical protein AAJ76_1650001374 [Vairimorpha ceranae]|uniref:Uncharacterized protein n=1 Tax=Vairimorpha ceranae TaxID=40302 RepID=A0A0F9W890_9MICR|nr:hypothetical protein AAJ76_1650001374 [Vairimorpha ceranae]KKO73946.1 hypothetical protein AAJ76_1650001374 [Vairimorpha ceranae]